MKRLVEKKTGTYADTLEAVGTAGLLRDLGHRNVTILDHGPAFEILSEDLPFENWSMPVSPGFTYIWEKGKEKTRPPIDNLLDYEEERQKRDAVRKRREKTREALADQDVELPEAHPEIGTATALASMRKGWNGDRDLAHWVVRHPAETASWIRGTLLGGPTPAGPAITNTQILNPISGKGVHAGKTEMRSAGSIPDELVDPFSEWMKLRGLWNAMLLYRDDEDFKFFVIEPANIQPYHLTLIRAELQKLPLWGGVKLDVQATLRCLEILLLHSDVVENAPGSIGIRGRRPRQVISGLRQAYFKSLGTAAALMNDAMLPLADWFAVEDRRDAESYLELIEEAIGKGGCLHSLQERNSDDGAILQRYRQWLLTGTLDDLLEFHHVFAVHLMQRLSGKQWARPFGTEGLNVLIGKAYKEQRMTEIIESDGFRSVARAIRNATVYAISRPNSSREVRFGLAQKWKQKMKSGNEEFAAAIGEFVQDYNWEATYRLKGKRHTVTTEQLDSLVALIQARGAEIVGGLLLAYGYARPKVETQADEE